MGSEKILLVDANTMNLQVLFHALEGCGHNLLVVKSGEAALEIAGKTHPDLILLDIMMPGIIIVVAEPIAAVSPPFVSTAKRDVV